MLRIAVVENDAPTREKLCTLIRDHAVSKGKDLAVTPLEDGSSLLGGALSGYDIIFLDIMLPTFLMRVNHLWLLWLLAYAGQAAALLFLTRLRLPGAAYCAVWSMTLTQLSAEAGLLLWYALQRFHWPKAESARKPADFPTRLAQLFLKY